MLAFSENFFLMLEKRIEINRIEDVKRSINNGDDRAACACEVRLIVKLDQLLKWNGLK